MSDYSDKIRASKLAKLSGSVATKVVTVVKKAVALDTLLPDRFGGVDTDFYLGKWDAVKARSNGVGFAFIRAGEYTEDPQFDNSWKSSRLVLPRGAYWFLTKDPYTSIGRQARIFASLFPNGYDGELPVVLDMEEDKFFRVRGESKARLHLSISDAYSFLSVLKDNLKGWNGKWIYYTNWSWQMTFGTQDPSILNVPLWYSNPPPYWTPDRMLNPIMPDPWKKYGLGYTFIQTSFAGDGKLYGGEEKGIDLNYFNGTLAQFKERFQIKDA